MSQPLRAAAVAPADLRRAASRFATGVALVTAPGDLALVVDSFISASLDPPLVAFAPSRTSLTWHRMRTDRPLRCQRARRRARREHP